MELIEAIRQRKSIRAFKSDPVLKENIQKILSAGIAAPSKGNSQIWEFIAVTGKKKREMDEMLLRLLKTDLIPSMKLGDAEDNNNETLKKIEKRVSSHKEEMSQVLLPLGLSFDDFMLEGTFTFFNAPAAILVFVDDAFSKDLPHILSVGASVQNILLTATAMGLGACWIGGVWRYTKNIREILNISGNKKLLSSIAIGYPDVNSPINRFKATREDLSGFIRWVGFDGIN